MQGPLRPWMRKLAEWHAGQDVTPTLEECHGMAQQFAGYQIPPVWTELCLLREDWLTYREEMALDEHLRVRKRLEHTFGEYVDTHAWALRTAREIGDYKEAANIASPVLDRVYPKRDQAVSGGGNVIINLPAGSTVHQTEPIEVEVLPVEKSE